MRDSSPPDPQATLRQPVDAHPQTRRADEDRQRVRYHAWLLALLLAALSIRLFNLGSFPGNVTADEADNLGVVYGILFGRGPSLFGLDWKPAPAFSMYVIAPFVALMRDSPLGVRLPNALISVAALVPLYALYRRYVSPLAALMALALLSAEVWYLNFSRSGWENVHVVLFTALAFWLLVRALETGQWRYWALAGVAASLGLYSYFGGRAILFALLAYAPFAVWPHHERGRRALGYALLVVVALGLFIPQLPAIAEDPDQFNRRAERVSVLNAEEYFGHGGAVDILAYQAWRNARFFFDGSALGGPSYSPPEQPLRDTRPRYSPFGEPLLHPVSALLFAAGLLLSLVRRRNSAMWWVMLLVPWLLTQVLTINTPDAARGIGMLPAVYSFVALSLDWLWQLASRRRAAQAVILGAVLLTAAATTASYFRWAASSEALAAREPAVPLETFEEWSRLQIELASRKEPAMPVTIWEERGEGH